MPALLVACVFVSAIGAGAAAPDLFDEIYARGKPLESTLKP